MADGDVLIIDSGHQAFVGGKILIGTPPTLDVPPDASGLVLLPSVLTWAQGVEDWCNTLRTALIDRGIAVAP